MTLEKLTAHIHITDEKPTQWHSLGSEEVLEKLDTFIEKGLTDQEAAASPGSIWTEPVWPKKPPPTFWQMLWEQFNNFVIMLLIVASVVSASCRISSKQPRSWRSSY